ncbi:MAG: acyl carrier protein, partial [Planctomycetota bacterium]
MGLDSVELLIGFEEAFGVRFTDDEAARMATIGETADIILARLQNEASNTCRTRSSFYTIRKALGPTIDSRHLPIRPATQLAELLPRRTRRADWRQLSKALGTDRILPLLHRPPWCKLLIFGFVIAVGLGTGLSTESVSVGCLAVVL